MEIENFGRVYSELLKYTLKNVSLATNKEFHKDEIKIIEIRMKK